MAAETATLAAAESDTHDDHDDHDDHGAAVIPAAALPRGRNIQVGATFLTGATLMYFGGLFAIYLSERADHLRLQDALGDDQPWIPDSAQVELTAPTMMAWTLLISIVTMQWAVWSVKRNDRRHALLAIGFQAVFAAALINHHVFQWKQLGLVADESVAAVLIYAITGSFVVALIVALFAFAFAMFRALAGASTQAHTDGLASVAVYWYALVGIYFVIWILVFITK